jgi:predicted metalloendopeptidase
VASVRIQIGIPSVWPIDRSDLFVDSESYIESVLSIRKYHVEKNYRFFIQHAAYGFEANGDNLFDGLVSNANAYYQHQLNTVTLTAGLLQPPIFSVLFDKVSLYSRFGVMFAHELSHSIDAIGVLFDTKGTYNPWVTAEGKELYQQRLDCFVETYSITTSHGNIHDGRQTLNENIADNCAVKIAYETFFEDIVSSTGNPPTIEQQRNFFISYAQIYCESLSKNQEQFLITHRSHAVNSLRVNNVVNQVSTFEMIWGCNRHDRSFSFKNKCSIF